MPVSAHDREAIATPIQATLGDLIGLSASGADAGALRAVVEANTFGCDYSEIAIEFPDYVARQSGSLDGQCNSSEHSVSGAQGSSDGHTLSGTMTTDGPKRLGSLIARI